MSTPLPTTLPALWRPPANPPTAALPAIPRTKPSRKGLPVTKLQTTSKLRLPASPRPSISSTPDHVMPALELQNWQSGPALGSARHTENPNRKTISIGAFPQPPNSALRPGTATSIASMTSTKKRTSESSDNGPSDSGRSKRQPRPSTTHTVRSSQRPQTPSLLNGSGAGQSIPVAPHRISDGQNSIPSPPHSRTSSANGSYSTSATTFEDADDELRGRLQEEDKTEVEDPKSSITKGKQSKGNVIVSVRVRPDSFGQGDSQTEIEWMVDGRRSLVAYRGREGGDYHFDNVFGTYDNNAKVYDASAKRLVRRVMEGYHGTVFAYGMTGTGKTFSMQGTATNPGVIPLAITDIFSYIRETPHREFLLRVSYLEIYNEKIHDLLTASTTGAIGADSGPQEEIKLREDSKRGIYASPLKEEIVQSPTQLLRVIARGDHSRRTSSTQWNSRSSRSHAVVQIVVESRERLPGSGALLGRTQVAMLPGGVRVSTLSLIDLAGSERAAEDKERRAEGAHINKSLLTLGTVIARLSGERDKIGNRMDRDGRHLPYRDSKLTRLLQPALSGNSLVSILCTIQIGSQGSSASANNHTGETLNTLKFAARARNNIVSHAKRAAEEVGSGVNAGLLERYRTEIQNLRSRLDGQHKDVSEREGTHIEKQAEKRHEEQMLEMQLARTALKERIEHLNRLILCSKSTGVNSGSVSALGMHSRLSGGTNGDVPRSVRTSASQSTLGNARTSFGQRQSGGSLGPSQHQPFSPTADGDQEEGGEQFADGRASLKAQNRALQADLQDKNRYIATLEKRLLQARRSSHSRMSMGFNKGADEDVATSKALEERESIIADLRARLDDKEKMVTTLRSALRKRETAVLTPETSSAEFKQKKSVHQSSDSNSNSSSLTGAVNGPSFLSPITPISPVALLSPQKGPDKKRKGVDEMSKILDGMIQDKVESGHLFKGRTGSVRIAVPNRMGSRGHSRQASGSTSTLTVPRIGSLVATLRE